MGLVKKPENMDGSSDFEAVFQVPAEMSLKKVDRAMLDLSACPVGTVVVKALCASICGSDLLWYHEPHHLDPLSPGGSVHEVVGVIADSKSPKFAVGDVVLALPSNYILKTNMRELSEEVREEVVKNLPPTGALSEYFFSFDSYTFRLPTQNNSHMALLHYTAAQPLGTIVWLYKHLPLLLGLDVVVVGQGANGLLATTMASNLGARSVIAVDLLPFRLEAAKLMKATHFINASTENTEEVVRTITQGRMADVVIDMVGHSGTDTLNQCVNLLKFGGAVVLFGVPHENEVYPFEIANLFRKNAALITSMSPERQDFELAITLIAQSRVDVSPLYTHSFSLSESDTALKMLLSQTSDIIKVGLKFDGVELIQPSHLLLPGREVWFFCYGSLMFDPGFAVYKKQTAVLHGYRRSFCVASTAYRGTHEHPGLVLGLERDSTAIVTGVALCASAADAKEAAEAVDSREQVRNVYLRMALPVFFANGRRQHCICYVADPSHKQYEPSLPPSTVASRLRTARGSKGANMDYLHSTIAALKSVGIVDEGLETLAGLVSI